LKHPGPACLGCGGAATGLAGTVLGRNEERGGMELFLGTTGWSWRGSGGVKLEELCVLGLDFRDIRSENEVA